MKDVGLCHTELQVKRQCDINESVPRIVSKMLSDACSERGYHLVHSLCLDQAVAHHMTGVMLCDRVAAYNKVCKAVLDQLHRRLG